jgi:hypothetical protein
MEPLLPRLDCAPQPALLPAGCAFLPSARPALTALTGSEICATVSSTSFRHGGFSSRSGYL